MKIVSGAKALMKVGLQPWAPHPTHSYRRTVSAQAAVRLEAELQECLEPAADTAAAAGRRLCGRTTVHASESSEVVGQSSAPPARADGGAAPSFDLALVSFAASYRARRARFWVPSTAGRLFVTATHLAFVPLLFGRRVAIHLDRIQCLVKLKAWRLLPGAGSSLQVVLNPVRCESEEQVGDAGGGGAAGGPGEQRVVETFYAIWERKQLCRTIQSAAAARDRRLTVYKQRLLRADAPAGQGGRKGGSAAGSVTV